jgi:hypothetical protein
MSYRIVDGMPFHATAVEVGGRALEESTETPSRYFAMLMIRDCVNSSRPS